MTALWSNDAELFALARAELFTAVVGDILDTMGLRHQFLAPRVKPIDPAMIVIGRAMPVLQADFFDDAYPGRDPISARPFGRLFEALDDLAAGEVYIATGAAPRYALWGGLMSTRAITCGAAGAVLDGYHRDTREILRLGFPVASHGSYAQDQGPRGKVVDWRVPIEVDGVAVRPGDIVFGDLDGVLIVPAAAAEEAFAGAVEKVRGEQTVLKALQSGMPSREAFDTYGIM